MKQLLNDKFILQQGTRETDPELAGGEATNGVNAGVTDGTSIESYSKRILIRDWTSACR
jgi:hypothetical protein